MVLSGKQAVRMRLARVAAGLVLCAAGARGAGDPEVDRWFVQHSEAEWRPLAEKWGASKAAMVSPVENLILRRWTTTPAGASRRCCARRRRRCFWTD